MQELVIAKPESSDDFGGHESRCKAAKHKNGLSVSRASRASTVKMVEGHHKAAATRRSTDCR